MVSGPKLNPDARKIVVEFIAGKVTSAKAKGAVVGLSGGVDSALVAELCVEALGKDRVLGLMLPSQDSDPSDLEDAKLVAKHIGIRTEVVGIGPMVKAFTESLGPSERELGNIKSRCRMIVLHKKAMSLGYLVAGTGNKSELLVGYFTKYGDGGVDFLPIGDLYKTQVWALAREVGLPDRIVKKVPTAGLWPGQTDEGELGITYENLDKVLFGIERGQSPEEISRSAKVPLRKVQRIEEMMEGTQHKRKMPYIPKIGVRTLGIDWRE
jgi:NAD+ synthase